MNNEKLGWLKVGIFLSVVVVALTACGRNEDVSPYADDEEQKELSTTVADKSESTFNSQEYDFRCADSILGMKISDQIFPDICGANCRPPSPDEL